MLVNTDAEGYQYSDLDAEEVEEFSRLVDAAEIIEDAPISYADVEDIPPRGLRLPTRSQSSHDHQSPTSSARREEPRIPVQTETPEPEVPTEPSEPDTRSPLERFRRPPKKAFSVTDLVSPAWCELQYWYTLTRHGRKRRTPAMKQGIQVHQALEDEVHVTVPVDTPTQEDAWGLRIWNVIQGLRTLRETGRTRELEIWGTVGGEIVNGVIDELSYECPDPGLEERIDKHNSKQQITPDLPEGQTSIADFLTSAAQAEDGSSLETALRPQTRKQKHKNIYITDIKTRQSRSLPGMSAMKPTILQLHLYHHLLENLAQGNFTLQQLADRYNFSPTTTFSDSFIAQVGSLNQEYDDHNDDTFPLTSSSDSLSILLNHNTPTTLWTYMLQELSLTFHNSPPTQHNTPTPTRQSISDLPPPPSGNQPTLLSPILTVSYLSSTYTTDPQHLGSKSFLFNAPYLKSYLEDSLTWWHGEREAKGVELQEAWKCRHCDFRDDCVWIHERDQASFKQAMERKALRAEVFAGGGGKSEV